MSRGTAPALAGLVLAVGIEMIAGGPARGAESPRLHPGAVEIGLAGALTSVEGNARATVAARAGSFLAARSGLAGFEVEVGYDHDRVLDGLDVEGALSWQHPVGSEALYPFASLGGGVRWESVGSFSQVRYPLGFALGMRALVGTRAAVRIGYRYRRITHDPAADFTEHQFLTGLSLLFRNPHAPAPAGR